MFLLIFLFFFFFGRSAAPVKLLPKACTLFVFGISGSKELYHVSIRKHLNAISLLEEVFVTSVLKQQISQLALYTAGTQSFTISQVIVIQAVPGINEMTYCKKQHLSNIG